MSRKRKGPRDYSEHLVAVYSAGMGRWPAYRLWNVVTDCGRNINARIAAVSLLPEALDDPDDMDAHAAGLRDTADTADAAGLRALADVAHDTADVLQDAADNAREFARCGYNLNLFYGVPRSL